jgi:TetR/AcrR family transcriptional regulator, regulator of autoinduction and epiphytic fitness
MNRDAPGSNHGARHALRKRQQTDMNNENIATFELTSQETEYSPWPDEPASDGRVARGQRTRRNVADALCQLLRDGEPDPTAKAIAEQAGVSLRLVFHHFADMDDLYLYVAALQLRRQWTDLPRVSPKLSLPTRIERTVSHRATLYEEISPVRRAVARRASTSPAIAAAVASGDTMLVENLKHVLAPELAQLPQGIREDHLEAMDIASSWEAWERMRRGSHLPVRSAKRVMARTLTVLCSYREQPANGVNGL